MHEPDLTVASWFSGGGGLDIGLERAGWSVVSHSEIDPYACALLEQRWPGVPNLGDIAKLADVSEGHHGERRPDPIDGRERDRRSPGRADGLDWTTATLWAGGPPCQDFSVAGKRAGLGGARSSLAVTWFDLVGRHRPRALLFENVPGILSSRDGLDWYALLRQVGELGYWWAYRVLDAQWFGVPQRRRRVWLLALDAERHPDPDGPAEVLAVGTRCGRDHAAEREAWASAAGRAGRGAGIVDQAVNAKWAKRSSGPAGDEHHHLVVEHTVGAIAPGAKGWRGMRGDGADPIVVDRAPADPGGVRTPPGMAGRVDGGRGMVPFVKGKWAQPVDDDETWRAGTVSPTVNGFDVGDTRATVTVVQSFDTKRGGPDDNEAQAGHLVVSHAGHADPLLPEGLDSHRYRVIGNGVASPQSEWIGHRLAAYLRGELA